MRLFRPVLACFAASALFLLFGCNFSQFSAPSTAASILPPFTGSVHGGQQPVSGASIQLYSINTTTLQGASAPLLANSVSTHADGTFNITGTYTCQSPSALVYIVATGGNPGLGGSVSNSAITEMAVLGTCGSLTASTFIYINELTTVAAVEALAPFMLDYAHIGAANIASLTFAFANAVAFVDPFTGQFRPTFPVGVTAPIALLNTLADILSACVNTNGSTANGTPCGTLFQYTIGGATGEIVLSLLSIIHHPTTNIAQLFALISSTSPFVPALSVAPANLAPSSSVALPAVGLHGDDQVLVDSHGNVWVLMYLSSQLAEYDNNLNLIQNINLVSVTGTTARFMTLDPFDNVWLALTSTLLKVNSAGIVSPVAGYQEIASAGVLGGVETLTSDSSGNIWVSALDPVTSNWCVVEYSNSGALITPAPGICTGVGFNSGNTSIVKLVPDSTGDIYIVYFGTGLVQKVTASGALSQFNEPSTTGYYAAVFDPKYGHIWAHSSNFDNFSLDGTLNFSQGGALALSVVPGSYSISLAVDGAGALWSVSEYGSLLELNQTGGAVTPCVSLSVCGLPITPIGGLSGITIDASGSLFTVNAAESRLVKFAGLAGAK